MWIFKIGGSWIMNHQLDELLSLISKFNKEKISIVTGGGCFADSVREAFNNSSMDENTGNFLALKATEMFCHLVKEINKDFKTINKKINSKLIFFFHNNPQEIRGSKTVKERLKILDKTDKVFFVSKWTQKKFFEGLPFKSKSNWPEVE